MPNSEGTGAPMPKAMKYFVATVSHSDDDDNDLASCDVSGHGMTNLPRMVLQGGLVEAEG